MEKIEVIIKGKRFLLGERAARIAIETMGATEVQPIEKPKELLTKTLPPIITRSLKIEEVKPAESVKEPVNEAEPVKKTRKPRIKK